MVNVPLAAETAVDVPAVAALVAVMVAPGIMPPPLSTTTPEMDELDAPCAKAGPLMSAQVSTIMTRVSDRGSLDIRSSGLGPGGYSSARDRKAAGRDRTER